MRYAAAGSMFLAASVVLTAGVFLDRGRVLRVVGALLVVAVVGAVVAGAGAVPLRAGGPVWSTQVHERAAFCEAHPRASVPIRAMPPRAGWSATVPCAMVEQADGG